MVGIAQHASSLDERLAEVSLEDALVLSVGRAADTKECPPRFASALRYAVFPGGARLRPRLLAAVSFAAGEPRAAAVASAGVAVELLHCASLVHDDLPCFDDTSMRRGKRALPRVYGEASAVLVGDALIMMAFEQLARVAHDADPACAGALVGELGSAAGARGGLVAGQAWEMEESVSLEEYHRAKTGSLFAFAARAGAILAGACPDAWGMVGWLLGRAYQVADDVLDATGGASTLGKPTGRDDALGRPNVVRALGLERARAQARHAIEEALDAIPKGPRAEELRYWLATQTAEAGVLGLARC